MAGEDAAGGVSGEGEVEPDCGVEGVVGAEEVEVGGRAEEVLVVDVTEDAGVDVWDVGDGEE